MATIARAGAAASALLAVLLSSCGAAGVQGAALEVPAGAPTPAGLPAVTASPLPTQRAESGAGTARAIVKRAESGAASALRTLTTKRFRMPKVTGMNLQSAQDRLHTLGSYLVDQRDATGEHRFQVIDADWKVCTQTPAAGQRVRVTAIVRLDAVKLGEHCP